MVLKQFATRHKIKGKFENDVEMYGAQTETLTLANLVRFENDVEMYGAQTNRNNRGDLLAFENDVEMYGAQTGDSCSVCVRSLRMM